jgi:NADPH-dependent glutamate synthase beta subunit-like oxidoreductase
MSLYLLDTVVPADQVDIGPSGLAVLKELREEGFTVTAFERRDIVGGVWAYSDNPEITSTLPCETDSAIVQENSYQEIVTVSNVSIFTVSFSCKGVSRWCLICSGFIHRLSIS